ncbi:MAG: Clp protease ClpP [Streptomyces sp.]|nr:Clp protease ClpP [Streptomyces sp.]
MKNVHPLKARISAQAGVTRVDVYDDIGEGGWFSEGLTAKSFANQLAGLNGPLEVHINSGGGDVWDGISIKNAIESHTGPVTTVVDGIAASIASVIAQAGTERVMMPGSMMMIHEAFTVAAGNAAELAKTAATLDEVSANLASLYAKSAGGTAEQWRAAMKEETWYTAEQAVAAGLADRTGDGEAALPAGFDVAAFADVPGRIAAQMRTLPRAAALGKDEPAKADQPEQPPALVISIADILDEDTIARLRAAVAERGPSAAAEFGGAVKPVVPKVANKALPVHHTATVDESWDGPAAVAAMPADDEVLRYCHAWESDEAANTPHKEGDDDADDKKSNFRFPHHKTKGGPANLAACRNGLARLEGSKIPEGDKAGVRAHLQAHLDDAHKNDGDSDEGNTDNHAKGLPEGLPAWLNTDSAPLPAWLATAEEATK